MQVPSEQVGEGKSIKSKARIIIGIHPPDIKKNKIERQKAIDPAPPESRQYEASDRLCVRVRQGKAWESLATTRRDIIFI